uniref:Uncharacterized protein n=1 Tax=Anguilla anguilla TaxID=7936 RepID=A0A0E9VBG5_ANGAN
MLLGVSYGVFGDPGSEKKKSGDCETGRMEIKRGTHMLNFYLSEWARTNTAISAGG